jgi:hypothetical protein
MGSHFYSNEKSFFSIIKIAIYDKTSKTLADELATKQVLEKPSDTALEVIDFLNKKQKDE